METAPICGNSAIQMAIQWLQTIIHDDFNLTITGEDNGI